MDLLVGDSLTLIGGSGTHVTVGDAFDTMGTDDGDRANGSGDLSTVGDLR